MSNIKEKMMTRQILFEDTPSSFATLYAAASPSTGVSWVFLSLLSFANRVEQLKTRVNAKDIKIFLYF